MAPKRAPVGRSKTKAQHAPPAQMRTLAELIAKPDEDHWPEIKGWIEGSNKLIARSNKTAEDEAAASGVAHHHETLDGIAATLPLHVIVPLPTPKRGEESLLALQVTTRSAMGAVTYNCSKIKLYGGWLTIVGAGCGGDHLSYSIGEWSAFCAAELALPPGLVLVAYDCVGGFFFLNGGALPQHVPVGQICYLPPDSAPSSDDQEIYMSFDMGYSDFLYQWALQPARVADFYSDFYFDGWQQAMTELETKNKKKATVAVSKEKEEEARAEESSAATAAAAAPTEKYEDDAVDPIVAKYFEDVAFGFYPFLFTSDMPIKDRSRRPISLEELFRLRVASLGLGAHANKGIDNE